jgi:pyrroline-5-carboxylate reductase
MENIGFIGMGNMAQALCKGFVASGKLDGKSIYAYAPHYDKLVENGKIYGFVPERSLKEMVSKVDTVIMACKPYQIEQVLSELGYEKKTGCTAAEFDCKADADNAHRQDKTDVDNEHRQEKTDFDNAHRQGKSDVDNARRQDKPECKTIENAIRLLDGKNLVSVAVSWNYERYRAILGDLVKVQYVMPNTPAMVREGVMLFEKENSLEAEERAQIMDLFSSVGEVIELAGNLMGIGGAVSGCGPAFVDLFIEGYADAAVKYGIPRDIAYKMVSQTLLGSAKLQLETGEHPGVLKDKVCSPGGTTIRGVASLEESGFRNACIKSIDRIMGN